MQQAERLAGHQLALGGARLRDRLVAADRDEAIQLALEGFGAREHGAGDLDGGDLPCGNEAAQFGCGQQAGIAVHRQITLRSRPSLADSIDSENDTSVNSASNTILMVNPYGFGMPMDLRRLRYFVAVAEARSVGKAAERLRMAQPPLSVQIRKLEAEIGAPLFRRGTHGMDLTEAGQALLARASEALALAADGAEAARAVASGQRGRLSVGYMIVLGNAVLPQLIPELRRSVPGVDLEFAELSASTREARLLDRSVTVALCMPAIHHPEIQVARIGAQPLMLAMPNRSPLARLGAVPLAKLQGCPLIALPPPDQDPASSAVAALLRRHQIVMPIASRVETVHAAMSLVLAGEGLAILPACASLAAPRGIVFRRLRDAADSIDIAVCWRRDSAEPADPHVSQMRREGRRAAVRRLTSSR